MLLHGYTGAIDIVSKNVVNYLDSVNNPEGENAKVSESTFNALKIRGYLTTKTEEEEVAYVRKLANLLHRKDKILYKGFLFLVAYDCNFRCPYCYEKNVLTNSRQWSKKAFTKEMVDKAFNAMLQIEPNRKLHSSGITLYGGEPLLAQNKEVVEYIVNKGKELEYSFSAITNGYDLDAFSELFGPGMIQSLQITVDGMKETHDKRRVHFKTGTSFDKIIKNIGLALEKDVSVKIRVNTDAINFDDIEQLEQLFKELNYTNLSINSAPVFNYNKTAGSSLNFFNQTEFNQRQKNINFKHQCGVTLLAKSLYSTIKYKKRYNFAATYCSAQVGMYILDPFGEIYSCWEDIGKSDMIIGNYLNDNVKWTKVRDLWHNQDIAHSEKCINCKYAFFCKGGCITRRVAQDGIFGAGFCNSFPQTFEYAINLAYQKLYENKIISKQNENENESETAPRILLEQ
jgi:uncharacterized protein